MHFRPTRTCLIIVILATLFLHQTSQICRSDGLVVKKRNYAGSLEEASQDRHVAVNDLSGGQIALELKGPNCRDLLAKGCTLDLHPSVFSVGDCAQSGLAKASVLIALTDETPTFLVVVRRSFSDYLCRWLAHAGSDEGIVFTEA